MNSTNNDYSLEEAIDFSIANEAEELKGDDKLGAAQLAYENAAFYAGQYGFSFELFRNELKKRGAR